MTDDNSIYVTKASDVRAGTIIKVDGGFTRLPPFSLHVVVEDAGGVYVPCGTGKHYLDGQYDDDESHYVGLKVVGDARSTAPNVILDTGEIALDNTEPGTEPHDSDTDMQAVHQPTQERMSFHVEMKGYTLSDMDDLIVQAAAQQIIGKFGSGILSKKIEERVITMMTEKVDAHLSTVTTDIMNQPMTPAYGKKEHVTLGEFIGLCGKDYLATAVDDSGKPDSKSGYFDSRRSQPRAQFLISKVITSKLDKEISSPVDAAVAEIKKAAQIKIDQIVADHKARLSAALAKVAA